MTVQCGGCTYSPGGITPRHAVGWLSRESAWLTEHPLVEERTSASLTVHVYIPARASERESKKERANYHAEGGNEVKVGGFLRDP